MSIPFQCTVNPLLTNSRGYFKHVLGGLNRDGGLIRDRGVLFNLAKIVVSVLHKELEHKVEKLKYKKLEVMQPRIKNNSELLTRRYKV